MVVVINFYFSIAELPERSYGADCRLYVPENPKNKFINIYVWFSVWTFLFCEDAHALLVVLAITLLKLDYMIYV